MVETKSKKRVGILRGGVGKHYTHSLQKGGEIISYISEKLSDKYKVIDILVDKDYIWHLGGVPINTSDLVNKIDVVWNTTHPSFSNILDSLAIPNVGNKDFLPKQMKQFGVQIPRSVVLPVYQKDFDGPRERYSIKKAKEIFQKFSAPWIVKSFTEDESMGIHLAKTFPELVDAIEDGVKHEKSILVEEFIAGKISSVHSVSGFRNEDIYVFPLGNAFGSFSSKEKEKLSNLAKDLHKHINSKHYLKIDFILNPRGKVYLLQIDGMPDLKIDSHFSQVCESVGAKTHSVIEGMLENVL